jgi:gamma-glutamyltranspeptidase/glutathione hydrolase
LKLFNHQQIEFKSQRVPILGRSGMVATSQPLAVAAGLEILSQGGNAADAAIAAAAAIAVTEPTSTGLGGDCFALYHDAATSQITALNGSGRAPADLSLERLRAEGLDKDLPPFHPYTVTVPGACAGWCDLIDRHGSMAMAQILAPAIRLAEEGFPVAPFTSYFWQRAAGGQLGRALGGQEMLIEGRGPRPGEIFENPGMVHTLETIANEGKAGFYQGPIAAGIAQVIKKAGGCLTEADLAEHTSTWDQPISTAYRGIRIWECPPNGQGLATLLALNILERFDLASLEPLSASRLHLEIEAMRLAFADTRWYVTDPAFCPVPLDGLLSKAYANERSRMIDLGRACSPPRYGTPTSSSDTIYLTTADREGNACSFINSNYMGFGTGLVPSGWGFTLQNRGHNFSLQAGHPNALAPRKRPYHTIIPAMATRASDDSLYASFGVMGGFMQPQGHLQVVTGLVDDGLDPQQALDRLRFCIEAEDTDGRVSLEAGISSETIAGLVAMGHPINVVSGMGRSLFGRGQIIYRDPTSGVLWGGSDPRADGCAMCLA